MPQESPQAKVPSGQRSNHDLLLAQVSTQPNVRVQPPLIVEADGEVFPKRRHVAFRLIQNCGLTAVKFLVDDVNDCTEENFHGILAAGSAVDDGLGSVYSFPIVGSRITVFGVAGGAIKVALFEGRNDEDI